MRERYYSSAQVAKFFGVDNRTLQDWRVSSAKGTKRFLPAQKDPADSRKRVYSLTDLVTFLENNPRYRHRVYSRLVEFPEQHGCRWVIAEAAPA